MTEAYILGIYILEWIKVGERGQKMAVTEEVVIDRRVIDRRVTEGEMLDVDAVVGKMIN